MDIQEFLLARIVEDEAEAKTAQSEFAHGGYGCYGPARVLAECAAKRAIMGGHERYGGSGEGSCATCTNWLDEHMYDRPPNVTWPCPTIVALAAVYSDHPDYQDEWSA